MSALQSALRPCVSGASTSAPCSIVPVLSRVAHCPSRQVVASPCSTSTSRPQQLQAQPSTSGRHHQQRGALAVARNNDGLPALIFTEGYTEVEAIEGVRLNLEGDAPVIEYLVKWKVRCTPSLPVLPVSGFISGRGDTAHLGPSIP